MEVFRLEHVEATEDMSYQREDSCLEMSIDTTPDWRRHCDTL